MCTPANLQVITSAMSNVASHVNEYNSMKANNEYRTQVALNNANAAQDQALYQKQLGIEKSRKEKISGLSEISRMKALNASSNLDVSSLTNELGYQDVADYSDYNASLVRKEHDLSANSYFKQANAYLNQANNYQKDYNQSLFEFSMNALGGAKKVANEWYKGGKEQKSDYI